MAKAYAGPRSAALAMLRQRADELPRSGQADTWRLGARLMLFAAVEGLAVVGERDECAKLYPLVPGGNRRWGRDQRLAAFGRDVRGHRRCGRRPVGGRGAALRTALRQAHELPHKLEQPEVRRWYARMLLDRDAPGDREKARELLTEAIAMYRAIGMPRHVELAAEMLGEV